MSWNWLQTYQVIDNRQVAIALYMAVGSVANAYKFVKLFRPYMDQLLTWKLLLPFTTSEAKRNKKKKLKLIFYLKKKKDEWWIAHLHN